MITAKNIKNTMTTIKMNMVNTFKRAIRSLNLENTYSSKRYKKTTISKGHNK